MGADRLRDFVLMMGKDQVLPAAMDVEGLSQMFFAHRRAFEMPARAPEAPRAVPTRLIFGGGLPQHEIGRVLLIRRDLYPGAGDQLIA